MNPDQYIQKRARQLPLFECLVSHNWKEGKQPGVIVSRKHTNGNITFCFYIVDLMCLGVIFTRHFFNVSMEEYHEIVNEIFENSPQAKLGTYNDPGEPFEKIPYNLAHNIIYAGYEYAADFDIPPYKEFIVTKYMLEEDTEEIELIDIECGMDGKPLFLIENLTDFSGFKPEFIIKKLNQHAGEGNYEVISKLDYMNPDFDEFDDDDECDEFDFDNLPEGYIAPEDYSSEDFERDKHILSEILKAKKESIEIDDEKFQMVVMRMAFYMAGAEKVQQVYEELFGLEYVVVNSDMIPDEVLPFGEMDSGLVKRVEDIVADIFSDNPLQMDSILSELHDLVPNQPFIAFLELVALHSRNEKDNTIKKLIEKYTQLYPDDKVLKLFDVYYRVMDSKNTSFLSREQLKLQTYFSDRRFLHFTEAMVYCTLLSVTLHQKESLEDLLALSMFMQEVDLAPEIVQSLVILVLLGLSQIIITKALESKPKPEK